jgi:hypothetical protein
MPKRHMAQAALMSLFLGLARSGVRRHVTRAAPPG